jgi:hypothetical protein
VISAVVKSYDAHSHVTYLAGGRSFDAGNVTGPYEARVDTKQFANGPLRIVIQATDSRNRIAGSTSVRVTVKNP